MRENQRGPSEATPRAIRRTGGESSKKASRINHYGKTGSMSPEENDETDTKDPQARQRRRRA